MQDGNALITVVGSGELAGDESITTTATGKVYLKNGSRYILYETTDENEAGVTVKYLLKLTGNTLEMTKNLMGQKTKIVYTPGNVTESDYNSPFGTLNLSFDTTSFFITETDEKLELELKYKILMGEDVLSRNVLKIRAEEKLSAYNPTDE